MARKLEEWEIKSMKKAVLEAEKSNEEYQFKIDLKQLQIDRGLDVNYRIKKRELEEEIVTLKGNRDFNNIVIDKYSQCVETGEVEIDVDEKELKEDLNSENN